MRSVGIRILLFNHMKVLEVIAASHFTNVLLRVEFMVDLLYLASIVQSQVRANTYIFRLEIFLFSQPIHKSSFVVKSSDAAEVKEEVSESLIAE